MAFNWTKFNTDTVAGTPTYNKCIFAGGSINLWVIVQSRSLSDVKRILTSPDGQTWTLRSTPEANSWTGVAFNGTTLVAVASTGATFQVATSTDGITWTGRTASEANAWQDVCWIGGSINLFVAVSQGGTHRAMTSPDGITWTNQTTPVTLKTWGGIATNGTNQLVASAGTNSTQSIMTSPDGVTWTLQTTPISLGFQNRGISYSSTLGQFIACSQTGTGHVVRSTDGGVTWTDWGTPPSGWTLTSIKLAIWSPELTKWVLVHTSTDAKVALSVDGDVWTTELMDNGVDDFFRPWAGLGYASSQTKFVIFEGGVDAVANASGAAAAPSVDLITPNSGTIRGGTAVSIDGHGFTAGDRVFFGAKEATSVVVNSATNITCVSPKGNALGTIQVIVRGPNV
jgi:hypothetical protein